MKFLLLMQSFDIFEIFKFSSDVSEEIFRASTSSKAYFHILYTFQHYYYYK